MDQCPVMFDILIANLLVYPISDSFMSDLGDYVVMLINWEIDTKYVTKMVEKNAQKNLHKKCSLLVVQSTLDKISYFME